MKSFLYLFLNILTSLYYLGNVYIADFLNHRIRKVTISTGIITTVAGTGSTGYSGDDGPATSASLNGPFDVAFDLAGIHSISFIFFFTLILSSFLFLGNFYITEIYNNRIRKVTISTGIITTYAGTGTSSFSGDNGPATSATFYYPGGLTLDSAGNSALRYYFLLSNFL